LYSLLSFFFFQAEDGIRDRNVTGVQTCALPILYTLSWEGHHLSGYQLSDSFDYVYLVGMSGNNIQLYNIQRTNVGGYTNRHHYTATFEMPSTITENTRILFGVSRDGESGGLAYVRFGKPKLELGTIASPFETSYSMLEQRADS